jgi:anti-sigma factor RsiW
LKCKDIVRELNSILDGELEPALLAEVERHLSHCEDCQLIVDQTRRTITFYCNSQPAALPDDVHNRLHAALRSRLQRH